MTNDTDITPVLTPAVLEDIERYGHTDMVEQTIWHRDDAWLLVMAIANHALTDGDPRKITRAEVDDARDLVDRMEDPSGWYGATSDSERIRLLDSHARLMAKLDALLPPE